MTAEASVPKWFEFNCDAMSLTLTRTSPLVPTPARGWSTLLKVLK